MEHELSQYKQRKNLFKCGTGKGGKLNMPVFAINLYEYQKSIIAYLNFE